MKKAIFSSIAILAILSLASFKKASALQEGNVVKGAKAITFGFSDVKAAVTVTDSAAVVTNGFTCVGIDDAAAKVNFNCDWTDNNTEKCFKSETPYYFPATGTMSFYAAYPKTTIAVGDGNASTISVATGSDTDYVAAKSEGVENNTDTRFLLSFKHILSQIKFGARGKDADKYFVVDTIAVKGYGAATYTINGNTFEYEGTESERDYYAEPTEGNGQQLGTGTGDTDTWQPIIDDASSQIYFPGTHKVRVGYSVYSDSEYKTLIAHYTKSADVTLEQGKISTINFVLTTDLKEITFNIEVEDWVEKTPEKIEL